MSHRSRNSASAVVLFLLCAVAPARAQIDLTGTFSMQSTLPDICTVTVTQTGTAIDLLFQCVFMQAGAMGTIDPMTGVFTASGGCVVGPIFGTMTVNGTGSADSSSFAGAFSCPPAVPGGPYSYTATRRCPGTPSATCRAAGKSLLIVRDSAPDSGDKLTWKWLKGEATTQPDFGAPTGTSGYTLCVYAGSAAVLAQANVPADATKWQPISDKGWKYKDHAGAASGITKVLLKGGTAGKSKVLVKGKGDGLPDYAASAFPVDPGDYPIGVQLLRNGTSECWQSSFAEADVQKNTDTLFKAKSD